MKKHIFFVYLVAVLVVLLGAYLSLAYSRVKTAAPNQNANAVPAANKNANEPPGGMIQTSSPHLRLAAPLSGALVASPLALIGEAIDPWTKLGQLSLAQRQMVEIAKALSKEVKLLIIDEPNASLSETLLKPAAAVSLKSPVNGLR